jgi:hypothetical protein
MGEWIQHFIKGSWGAREETPERLAARFLRMIDILAGIDPAFRSWDCHYRRPKTLESLRDRFAEEVAANIEGNGSGTTWPEAGYRIGAFTRDEPEGRSFGISCRVGATMTENPFPNEATMATFGRRNPDPDIVSFRVTRAAVLAIVDAWEPADVAVFSNLLFLRNPKGGHFRKAWIQYLCPWLAEKITPPSTALVERLPDGGLLMSATTENFEVSNPQHLAVATDIAAAMAPIERLTWPSEDRSPES